MASDSNTGRDDAAEDRVPADAVSILSVVVGSGTRRSEVGAAVLDAEQKTLTLFNFSNNESNDQLLDLVTRVKPKQCLVPNVAGLESCQYAVSVQTFGQCGVVTPCDKDTFLPEKGFELVLQFCSGSEHVLSPDLADRELGLAAAAALIPFVDKFAPLTPRSLRLVAAGSESGLMMDMDTIRCLEIFHNSAGSHRDSLFAFLNRTRTLPGFRYLRACLFEPSVSVPDLTQRQDSVQELLTNESLFHAADEFLNLMQVDLDSLISRLNHNARSDGTKGLDNQIEAVVFLRHVVALIPAVVQQLLTSRTQLLLRIGEHLSGGSYAEMLQQIDRFISDECFVSGGNLNFRSSKIFALRPDVDPNLQMQRNVFCEHLEELNNLVKRLDHDWDLGGSLKLVNSVSGGYHLEVPRTTIQSRPLPPIFYSCAVGSSSMSESKNAKYTTDEIETQNSVIDQVMRNVTALTNGALQPLLTFLRDKDRMSHIHQLRDRIAELDFLMSLAVVAKDHKMVRPVFAEETNLKQSANPIFLHLSRASNGRNTVTNNVRLSKSVPLMLVTGPNMSGKSGYLRQVALLQIMAQIGSFLPVEGEPLVRVVDRILTRIGSDSDTVTTKSTFVAEVAQVQYLLSKLTPESLVVIDELGRGTSDEDGVAICVAVCEALMRKKVFALFATHFHDLVRLQNLYPFMHSFQMDYELDEDQVKFTFKLKRRPLDDDKVAGLTHGIQLAEKIAGLTEVAAAARELLPQVDVYRKELLVQMTDLHKYQKLARHLQALAKHPVDQKTSYHLQHTVKPQFMRK